MFCGSDNWRCCDLLFCNLSVCFFGSEKFVGLINIFSVALGGEWSTFRVMNWKGEVEFFVFYLISGGTERVWKGILSNCQIFTLKSLLLNILYILINFDYYKNRLIQ